MNFLTVEYFLAVAQEQTFTGAAQRLYITQQTLSGHIAALEEELGCRLFERTKPLRLTYEGQIFARYAAELDPLYRSLRREFQELRQGMRGRLRLGVAHTRGRVLLPDVLCRYRELYPGLEVEIREGRNEELAGFLKRGEIDLMIGLPLTEEPEFLWEDYMEENILLVGSRRLVERVCGCPAGEVQRQLSAAASLAPLRDCPFLLGAAGDIGASVGRALLRQSGVVPQVAARSENVETLVALALRQLGLCFCPDNLLGAILPETQREDLVCFSLGAEARYSLKFGMLKQRWQPQPLRDFIELCRRARRAPFGAGLPGLAAAPAGDLPVRGQTDGL